MLCMAQDTQDKNGCVLAVTKENGPMVRTETVRRHRFYNTGK